METMIQILNVLVLEQQGGTAETMQAAEKLPEEQRAVLLKAGKVQNFVSIVIENKCLEEENMRKGRTTKKDRLCDNGNRPGFRNALALGL